MNSDDVEKKMWNLCKEKSIHLSTEACLSDCGWTNCIYLADGEKKKPPEKPWAETPKSEKFKQHIRGCQKAKDNHKKELEEGIKALMADNPSKEKIEEIKEEMEKGKKVLEKLFDIDDLDKWAGFSSSSMIDKEFNQQQQKQNSYWIWIAGGLGGVALVGIIIWWLIKRKKKN